MLRRNIAELAILQSEELSCKVADEDIVTVIRFEKLEMVKYTPDNDPGILSATHEADTHILFHPKDTQLHGF